MMIALEAPSGQNHTKGISLTPWFLSASASGSPRKKRARQVVRLPEQAVAGRRQVPLVPQVLHHVGRCQREAGVLVRAPVMSDEFRVDERLFVWRLQHYD
jgi:hypothetical protein